MPKELRESDDHSLGLRIILPFLRFFVGGLFLVLFAPIVRKSRERIPKSGPLLIFSNHLSNCDPIIVQYASPRLFHFMARKELFAMGALGKFMLWFKAFPVKQNSADSGAIKRAISLVNKGYAVVVFPEGQLSPDGKLLPLFAGAALLARSTGAPCLCVGLKGTNKVLPSPRVVPKFSFHKIVATWGEVRQFSKTDSAESVLDWLEHELRRLSDQT